MTALAVLFLLVESPEIVGLKLVAPQSKRAKATKAKRKASAAKSSSPQKRDF